jgi:hypothetical protein
MKKTFVLFALSGILLIAGCTEKDLIKNVSGTWGVQKYLFNGADRTATFNNTKRDFRWTFNENKTYTEKWNVYDSINEVTSPMNYTGSWTLTNSNRFLQLTRSDSVVSEYRIDEHSAKSLKLFKGNEEIWLEPK